MVRLGPSQLCFVDRDQFGERSVGAMPRIARRRATYQALRNLRTVCRSGDQPRTRQWLSPAAIPQASVSKVPVSTVSRPRKATTTRFETRSYLTFIPVSYSRCLTNDPFRRPRAVVPTCSTNRSWTVAGKFRDSAYVELPTWDASPRR